MLIITPMNVINCKDFSLIYESKYLHMRKPLIICDVAFPFLCLAIITLQSSLFLFFTFLMFMYLSRRKFHMIVVHLGWSCCYSLDALKLVFIFVHLLISRVNILLYAYICICSNMYLSLN